MKRFFRLLLLALATLSAYFPALRNGMVWDDTALILRDPFIRSWRLIPEGFQHFLFTDATASDFYRPIQRLVYTLEYWAYGVRPFGYHLVGVAAHFAAAAALFFLLGELFRFFGREERGLRYVPPLAALVWAIHPVHNGAVAYISGLADPLAAAFGFAGLWSLLRSVRAESRLHQISYAVSAAICLLLGALSKEAGLIFLAAAPLIFWLRHERKTALRCAFAALGLFVVYLSLRLPAEHIPAPTIRPPAPLLVRPILTARAFAEYAYLLAFPLHLHMERDVETHPNGFGPESFNQASLREFETVAGLLLLGAFAFWMWRERRRDHAVFACLALTVLTYLPISGIFPLNASIAEHWLYLPSAFLFAALGLCGARFFAAQPMRARSARVLFSAAFAAWMIFLGVRSFVRCSDWKDQRTFFERAIATGGDTPRMRINLAGVDLSENRLDAAKANLQAALAKEPDQPFALLNSGAVAVRQGDFKTAREFLSRAVKMPVVEAQAHELLTILANKEGGEVDLLRMRLASRTGPSNWAIEKRYVKLLDETGSTERAIAELQQCLKTEWYRAESWQLLSQLLAKSGRTAEAASALAKAQRYDTRLEARPKTI